MNSKKKPATGQTVTLKLVPECGEELCDGCIFNTGSTDACAIIDVAELMCTYDTIFKLVEEEPSDAESS